MTDHDELARLEAAATPGPWIGDIPGNGSKVYIHHAGHGVLFAHMDAADLAFIVAARNNFPALLRRLATAEQVCKIIDTRDDGPALQKFAELHAAMDAWRALAQRSEP